MKTIGDTAGDFSADELMVIEGDDIIGLFFESGGFTDVMNKSGEKGNCVLGLAIFERGEGMGADVIEMMALGGALVDAKHFFSFREDFLEERGVTKKFDSFGGMRRKKDFKKFIANAFVGDVVDEGGVGGDSIEGVLFDSETQLGGEADGAEEAKGIFGKALVRVADGTDEFTAEILLTIEGVDDGEG